MFAGPFEVEAQRRAVVDVLEAVGFDEDGWRLDPAPHPFAQSLDASDVRITTRYDLHDFGVAHYSALHEFGHGLYEAGIPPALARTSLGGPVSLGVHESQSRLWENVVGRSRPFCAWVLPRLREHLGEALGAIDADGLYRAVNSVGPSLIRVDADETTYNLHIVLRFELELALIEGALEVDDLPAAWNEGMARLLGVEVPDDAQGVLQDVHWGAGLFGYFPTYTLGNLMAAQLWTRVSADLPDVEERIGAGDFAPLREWLREHIHRHGRKFPPRELLHRVTGEELRTEPFLDYLRAKLADVAVRAASRPSPAAASLPAAHAPRAGALRARLRPERQHLALLHRQLEGAADGGGVGDDQAVGAGLRRRLGQREQRPRASRVVGGRADHAGRYQVAVERHPADHQPRGVAGAAQRACPDLADRDPQPPDRAADRTCLVAPGHGQRTLAAARAQRLLGVGLHVGRRVAHHEHRGRLRAGSAPMSDRAPAAGGLERGSRRRRSRSAAAPRRRPRARRAVASREPGRAACGQRRPARAHVDRL